MPTSVFWNGIIPTECVIPKLGVLQPSEGSGVDYRCSLSAAS
jgi:hypothetical protein